MVLINNETAGIAAARGAFVKLTAAFAICKLMTQVTINIR
jgi:hypothetical protein